MDSVKIIFILTALCCAVQGRSTRDKRFVNNIPTHSMGMEAPMNLGSILSFFQNPGMGQPGTGMNRMAGQGQMPPVGQNRIAGQGQTSRVVNQGSGQPSGRGTLVQNKVQSPTTPVPRKGQNPRSNSVQSGGQAMAGQRNNFGRVPGMAGRRNNNQFLGPMGSNRDFQNQRRPQQQGQGFFGRQPARQNNFMNQMFNDPMFSMLMKRMMRGSRFMKPRYMKGQYLPARGLFPGGYVETADGTDANVRGMNGKLYTIDGGIMQP